MHIRTFFVRQASLAVAVCAAFAALSHPASAQAPADPVDVAFTMPTPGQIVAPGSNVLFDATFTSLGLATFLLTDATFTSTDPTVNSEITGGSISGFFDGSDGLGAPVTVGPGVTSQPGIYELDLDPTLPGGQTISGKIAFTGYDTSDAAKTPIEVAAQSFSVTTASATVAPEPSSVATVAVVGLFAAGLMLKARRRRTAA